MLRNRSISSNNKPIHIGNQLASNLLSKIINSSHLGNPK